jgi:hypothetical protein
LFTGSVGATCIWIFIYEQAAPTDLKKLYVLFLITGKTYGLVHLN